ncbi:MAG: CDP-alcohol phosphatidyltransferase family protein [Alphaproteobacteria bacterium]|nr:CDP-alcohol phosphatidyltransferase family protein [Alphaproteobacteria bacterium]
MNLPNYISLARLLSAPVGIWFILNGSLADAFWLFLAAGLSDAVDGFVAKRFNSRSDLGALLDPIADKVLIVSMVVTLGLAGYLPNWLVILVVFRDLLIIGGFILTQFAAEPFSSRPLLISKLNTVLQIVLIAWVLAHLGLGVADHHLATILIDAVAATTVLSGGVYLVRWMRGFPGAEEA